MLGLYCYNYVRKENIDWVEAALLISKTREFDDEDRVRKEVLPKSIGLVKANRLGSF